MKYSPGRCGTQVLPIAGGMARRTVTQSGFLIQWRGTLNRLRFAVLRVNAMTEPSGLMAAPIGATTLAPGTFKNSDSSRMTCLMLGRLVVGSTGTATLEACSRLA